MQGFINKHTAFAILLLVAGCFFAGYYLGESVERNRHNAPVVAVCPSGELCL